MTILYSFFMLICERLYLSVNGKQKTQLGANITKMNRFGQKTYINV